MFLINILYQLLLKQCYDAAPFIPSKMLFGKLLLATICVCAFCVLAISATSTHHSAPVPFEDIRPPSGFKSETLRQGNCGYVLRR